jgi:drug/metabolite transporter (DMT)-like permease
MTTLENRASNENIKSHPYFVFLSLVLFHQFLGSMAFPISKYGLTYIEPFTFGFYRFVISSILLLLIVKFRGKKNPIEKKDYLKIAGIGFLIIPLNQVMYLCGQSLTAASHGALLFATTPIWIILGATLHLKEKQTHRRVIGIITAVIGVTIVVLTGARDFGREYLLGDIIIIVAVIAWAYYTILGKDIVRKYGAIRTTAYAFTAGTLLYFPLGLYKAINFDYSSIPIGAWWSVIYMAVGLSIIAYIIWYWLLKYYDASRIAVYQNIQPLLATVVAFLWLGEPVDWSFVIGGLIVLGGVIIAET